MKYFLDTEFLEGTQKSLLGKTNPTIDLISIGIVSEDGREYYAISEDFNLKEAWNRYDLKEVSGKDLRSWQINRSIIFKDTKTYKKVYWIRENVLKPIWEELKVKEYGGSITRNFTYNNFKWLIKEYGKTNKQIAEEIKEFCSIGSVISNSGYNVKHYKEYNDSVNTWIKVETIEKNNPVHYDNKPQFYAYYADYDWVVFCWLFGKMIDLPSGFPMYCIDLKQEVDNYISKTWKDVEMSTWGHGGITLNKLKQHPNYPKQTNEHNALADARWNKELYEFLENI